jgi:hypothetical protein
MRQRWCDAILERFMGRDILSTVNRFAYAANEPSTMIDPNGMKSILVIVGSPGPNGTYRFEQAAETFRRGAEANGDSVNIVNPFEDHNGRAYSNASAKDLKKIGRDALNEFWTYVNSGSYDDFVYLGHGTADDIWVWPGHGITKADIIKNLKARFKHSAFYSCDAGTTGSDSLAQLWANATGSETEAMVGEMLFKWFQEGPFGPDVPDEPGDHYDSLGRYRGVYPIPGRLAPGSWRLGHFDIFYPQSGGR